MTNYFEFFFGEVGTLRQITLKLFWGVEYIQTNYFEIFLGGRVPYVNYFEIFLAR